MVVGPQVDATLVVAMAFAIDVPGRAMNVGIWMPGMPGSEVSIHRNHNS